MKKLLFVSDIMGTISGASEGDYETLANQLLQLKEKHGAEEVIFSLCTGDDSPSYLKQYYNEAKSVFNNYNITMGKQFYSYGCLEENETGDLQSCHAEGEGKITKIINYTKQLQSDNQIVAVYFTDDNLESSYVNGYVELKLDDELYYHFISIGSIHNSTSYNFSSSMKRNVEGVIEAINFHLGMKKIKDANKEFWELRKIEEEKENRKRKLWEEKIAEENKKAEEEKNKTIQLRLEQEQQVKLKKEKIELEKEKKRLEVCANNQFVDTTNDNIEYNKWLKKIKNQYFNTIPVDVIFSDDYGQEFQCYSTDEWNAKPNLETYSLYEVIQALNYIDLLTIMMLCCNEVNLTETVGNFFIEDDYKELIGLSKSTKEIINAPIKDCYKKLRVNDNYEINMIDFLMKNEKVSLYSLVDTIVAYAKNDPDLEVILRNNSCINQDLLKRLIEVKNSENYNDITNTLMEEQKTLVLKQSNNKSNIDEDDDDTCLPFDL